MTARSQQLHRRSPFRRRPDRARRTVTTRGWNVARHRSPRGRRPLLAVGSAAEQQGPARSGRPIHTRPSMLGAAAIVGGALAAATTPLPSAVSADRAAALRVDTAAGSTDPDAGVRPVALAITERSEVEVLGSSVDGRSVVEQLAALRKGVTAEAAAGAATLREAEVERANRAACPPDDAGFGPVKPWVADAGILLRCTFGVTTVGGVAKRSTPSDHPLGLALDFKVDKQTGDALAACALANREQLAVKYVIWQQRISYGNGWQPMENRGSPTANHMGHVHISFQARPGGDLDKDLCSAA